MGSWGIALDMAKINEENLSKLSRKTLFEKVKSHGSYSVKKIYKYKKATPELLNTIREKRKLENRELARKKLVLASCCFILILALLSIVLIFI